MVADFQTAYPDIKVNFIGAKSADWVPRIKAERSAGQYLWDVFVGGGPQSRDQLLKPGYLDPLLPVLITPDIRVDSTWEGGFTKGFIDTGKEYIYRFGTELAPVAYVNRKMAPKTELNTIEGLLDPKWKGKIGMRPGEAGLVRNSLGAQLIVRGKDGEAWLQKLLAQDIKVMSDERMVAEGLIRGSLAIAIGVTPTAIAQFAQQGLAGDIEALEPDAATGSTISGGNTYVAVFKNAPNLNAQKVFVNWLLSQAALQSWEDKTNTPVRRTDTKQTATAPRPKPGIDYKNMDGEEVQPYMNRATEMVNAANK